MSWLATLGKIAAVGAAPFTGGATLAAIPAIDAIGGIASGAAKGSADQRMAENQSAVGFGNLQNTQARDQFTADLAGANYQREGQDRARRMALLSALLGGVQDASITPGNPAIAAKMPTMTGGLRPSALAGGKDSILSLIGGQTDPTAPTYTAPNLPQLQQAGKVEKILGGAGLGANVLGALGKRNPAGGGGR